MVSLCIPNQIFLYPVKQFADPDQISSLSSYAHQNKAPPYKPKLVVKRQVLIPTQRDSLRLKAHQSGFLYLLQTCREYYHFLESMFSEARMLAA